MADKKDNPLIYTPPTPPTHSVILLHGLGASGDDLLPLAPLLAGGVCRVVCPNAPMQGVTVNGGMVMPAWYDIIGTDLSDRQDRAGVTQSTTLIEQLIDSEVQKGFSYNRIFIAGFSQGAAMSLHVGLHYPHTLAGIIALSGYLLFADQPVPTHNQSIPIFQGHGRYDPVVLPQWARASHELLQGHGFSITYREYNAMHTIPPEAVDDLNEWLLPLLSTASSSTSNSY